MSAGRISEKPTASLPPWKTSSSGLRVSTVIHAGAAGEKRARSSLRRYAGAAKVSSSSPKALRGCSVAKGTEKGPPLHSPWFGQTGCSRSHSTLRQSVTSPPSSIRHGACPSTAFRSRPSISSMVISCESPSPANAGMGGSSTSLTTSHRPPRGSSAETTTCAGCVGTEGTQRPELPPGTAGSSRWSTFTFRRNRR